MTRQKLIFIRPPCSKTLALARIVISNFFYREPVVPDEDEDVVDLGGLPFQSMEVEVAGGLKLKFQGGMLVLQTCISVNLFFSEIFFLAKYYRFRCGLQVKR